MQSRRADFSTIKLFSSLNEQDRQAIERQCKWRSYRPHEVIIDTLDAGSSVYFVIRGKVRASICIAAQASIMRDISAGEYFGEVAAIDNRPRSADIHCLTDVLVASMPAKVFLNAFHTHPTVAMQVLTSLTDLVRTLTDRVNETSALAMKHRLVAELLRLSRPSRSTNLHVITPPPTHTELAARIGSHREAVTRELNVLIRNGLVTRNRGAFLLTDRNKLQLYLDKALHG
ncbi:Crp/Fnr family transcriptional regulator [Rhizobium sp. CFBP 8762]|uniref:Crp/Fnr family transcriptional regulator n=1 Tax=Rhizobium sp. CFBP 8762 TaxID=2775279 RepID=UPI001786724B|nr:Crp/Fnr family transcriptional regulator [Rhizobium sp. CFBP 8762]MBD8555102.1 Crp/Fnr family transcriptional regulator [Rhizobium sp. CFBP 8762]